MPQHKYIIIDIETLSTQHNAAVFAIAVLDHNGKGFKWFCDLTEQPAADRDDETILWWISEGATWLQARFTESGKQRIRTAAEILADLKALYTRNQGDVWVRGPDFDLPILANYFKLDDRNKLPWKYQAVRDVRTAEALTGTPEHDFTKHDPEHDCLIAKAIIDLYYNAIDQRKAAQI